MAQSVKLADEIMTLVRREAELHSRSVAGQITHWLRIGRAIEQSDAFSHARITEALDGRVDTTQLGKDEEAPWLEAFTDRMGQASAEEGVFYARRRTLGQGVGLDAGGNLVHARTDAPA